MPKPKTKIDRKRNDGGCSTQAINGGEIDMD